MENLKSRNVKWKFYCILCEYVKSTLVLNGGGFYREN